VSDVRQVAVPVATLWSSPEAPRDLDAAAVADEPDMAAWVAAITPEEASTGLHGRTLTQLVRGEPFEVHEEADGWLRGIAPWQPKPGHAGYPGWLRATHVGPAADVAPLPGPTGHDVLDVARRFVGVRYLWGGTSEWGVDCSGLVHLAFRTAGARVPRDACDQHSWDGTRPVPLDDVQPGDLYFFARPGGVVHHVGFATGVVGADGSRPMLHAPEGGLVEDAPMTAGRRELLVAAGRIVTPAG
jgi:cell wall-associated NlpC family hydrolase